MIDASSVLAKKQRERERHTLVVCSTILHTMKKGKVEATHNTTHNTIDERSSEKDFKTKK